MLCEYNGYTMRVSYAINADEAMSNVSKRLLATHAVTMRVRQRGHSLLVAMMRSEQSSVRYALGLTYADTLQDGRSPPLRASPPRLDIRHIVRARLLVLDRSAQVGEDQPG